MRVALADCGRSGHMAGWTNEELEIVCDAYFYMLDCERSGTTYVKRRVNAEVQAATGRTAAAVEFKFANFSAVLNELGLEYVEGYKPRSHYQAAMREVVERRIELLPSGPLGSSPTRDESLSSNRIRQEQEAMAIGSGEFEFLWGQATGGSSVAVHLGENSNSFTSSPRPPGVEEALRWFRSGRQLGGPQKMLFLVGGPGAGKSHAAREACAGLREVQPIKDGLAQRTYRYETPGRGLLVVNDATIGSDSHKGGALVGDIEDALADELDLLACINRGVIVEELRLSRDGSAPRGISNEIVRWLHSGGDSRWPSQAIEIVSTFDCEYLRTATAAISDQKSIEITVVFLDVCSLLEVRPRVSIVTGPNGRMQFDAVTYSVTGFSKRGSLTGEEVPAIRMLANVVGSVPSTSGALPESWNPFEANRMTLEVVEVASSLCSIFRAAEIVSTIRFTYRELWGAVVRALFGRAPEMVLSGDFVDWLRGKNIGSGSAVSEFNAIRALAAFRFSEAIFGNDGEVDAANPVSRLLGPVDPVFDARPGYLSLVETGGWATPVYDAFSGGSREDSPLESLLRDTNPAVDHIHAAVSEFDRNIDSIYMRLRQGEGVKEADLNLATNWYGTYLLRLYAVSNGIPAFHREVSEWTKIWFSKPALPTSLEGPLATLLLPRRDPNSPRANYLLPLLDSRTVPIQNEEAEARLAIRGESAEVSVETIGDTAAALLTKNGREVGKIECDFPLIREALSCANGHLGITEFTHSVSPRLERFRASQLLADSVSNAQLCVVTRRGEDTVKVRKS